MSSAGAKVKVAADLTVTKRQHVIDGTPCWCLPGYVHGTTYPESETILGMGAATNYPPSATTTANAAQVTESDE